MLFTNPPRFAYELTQRSKNLKVRYRWESDLQDFDMPIEILGPKGDYVRIKPTTEWQELTLKKMEKKDFRIASELYYVGLPK